jgi:hypothetical protein
MPSSGNIKRTKAKTAAAPAGCGLKFVQNTFALVNNYDGKSPLVCGWAPDGLSFGIFCSEQHFATTFKAGGYFKHEKYRSFVRQLNHYGFRKLRDDELPVHSIAGNYYQHENFMKGREDLLKFISAKINKGETEERSQLRQRIITLERNMQYFLQVLSPQQRTAFQALCGPIGELKCEGTAFDVDEEDGDHDDTMDHAAAASSSSSSSSSFSGVVPAMIPAPVPASSCSSSSSSSSSFSAARCSNRPRRQGTNYKHGAFNETEEEDGSGFEDDDLIFVPGHCNALKRSAALHNNFSDSDDSDDTEEDEDDDDNAPFQLPQRLNRGKDFIDPGHTSARHSISGKSSLPRRLPRAYPTDHQQQQQQALSPPDQLGRTFSNSLSLDFDMSTGESSRWQHFGTSPPDASGELAVGGSPQLQLGGVGGAIGIVGIGRTPSWGPDLRPIQSAGQQQQQHTKQQLGDVVVIAGTGNGNGAAALGQFTVPTGMF